MARGALVNDVEEGLCHAEACEPPGGSPSAEGVDLQGVTVAREAASAGKGGTAGPSRSQLDALAADGAVHRLLHSMLKATRKWSPGF